MGVIDVGVLLDGMAAATGDPLGCQQAIHSHRAARMYPPGADADLHRE